MKKVVLSALLVGCGGGEPVAIDDLGLELATVSCGKMFDCCTDEELMKQFMGITYDDQPITTEDQCVSFTNALFSGLAVTQYKASIDKGRVAYDADAAGDCIAAIEDLSCTEYGTGNIDDSIRGDCRPFLIPKVSDGGACTEDFECTSDNCVGAEDDVDGACAAVPTAGQACTDACADGLYCGFDTSNGMRLCLAIKADGETCSLDHECKSDECDNTSRTCVTPAPSCDGR